MSELLEWFWQEFVLRSLAHICNTICLFACLSVRLSVNYYLSTPKELYKSKIKIYMYIWDRLAKISVKSNTQSYWSMKYTLLQTKNGFLHVFHKPLISMYTVTADMFSYPHLTGAEYFVYHTMILFFVKAISPVYLSVFVPFVRRYVPLPRSHCTTNHVVCFT
jgi:hypothetical protein